MRNLWCLEKNSILPLVISVTAIVPQSLFKNLKILDLGNTLVVEIQKGILLYIILKHNKVKMWRQDACNYVELFRIHLIITFRHFYYSTIRENRDN
jgi:hypothetical protein